MRVLDITARRYGVLPTELLKLPPGEFAVNASLALKARDMDFENRTGEFWHITILEALGVKFDKTPSRTQASSKNNPIDYSKIEWKQI